MIKNLKKDKIENSKLFYEFKNISIDNYIFNYLHSDFIIDTKFFFPISVKSFATSTDIFGNFSKYKYDIYFKKEYFEFIIKNMTKIKSYNNALIIGSSNNYYHLLLDFLPRLFSLNKNIIEKIDKIIFSKEYLEQNNVVQSILDELNIKKKLIFLDKGSYLFRDSFIPSNFSLEKKIFFYKKLFSKYLGGQTNDKIYVSRKDSANRIIFNENELINFLKKKNFQILEMSNLDFINQVKIFNNAKIIISMHGAGLANLIFTKHGASVVEIVPDLSYETDDWFVNTKNYNHEYKIRKHFIDITNINEINHYLYFCSNNDNKKINENQKNRYINITKTGLSIDIYKFSEFYLKYLDNI